MLLNVTDNEANWWYGGIDFDIPGYGGAHCRDHVTPEHRAFETAVGASLALLALVVGYKLLKSDPKAVSPNVRLDGGYDEISRIVLLISFSFTYGLEVSYKFSTRQLIFLLNPCHVISVLEIYLLAALPYVDPNKTSLSTTLFRCVLHWFHGPLVAIIFPVAHSLFLPFESETYWIQHILLVIVPVYLILFSRRYSAHRPLDPSWLLISYGLWGLYHWCVLQALSVHTLANVGNMLCAAISDPFYGPNYRLHAIWHQFVCTAIMGTVCGFAARAANVGKGFLGSLAKKQN